MQQPTTASYPVTVLVGVVSSALWLALAGFLWLIVPGYEQTFADFRMRVPLVTEWAINLSRWLTTFWFLTVPAWTAVVVGLPVLTWFIRHEARSRSLGWLWSMAVILLPLTLIGLFWASCHLPFLRLLEALER